MPKRVPELSPLQLKRKALTPGFHAVGGVAGLHLSVSPTLAASWILKKTVGSRRQEMGLGGYPDVTLAMARDKARAYAELISQGIDPLAEKRATRSALILAQAKDLTFKQVATRYIAKKSREFKTAKQTQKLTNQLASYAYPFIGHMIVSEIQRANIVRMLEPIWQEKTETATRLRASVERILDLAAAEGLRTGDNPARWAGNLSLSLPNPGKVSTVRHYKALSLADMPAFMQRLTEQKYMSAKALQFCILTAARSGEVRGATWNEVDLHAKVWTIPAERMKGGRAHKVPLCTSAVSLLESLSRDSEYLFHNTKGGPLSDVSVSKVPKQLGHDVTVHGFRATFRTWAQEHTNYRDEVCELALAHVNSDSTRAAYARSELLDKRRLLMQDWERFCREGLPARGKVIRIGNAE
ncbi:site-specific integrase [Haliea sp.]|jgi:integrase|nr:site-specific integrase [Haliea sp.]|tara:strand:+ start:69031 stop:70263 length:1233 start_codon:yes stop_codon:yes gene_type:complete